MLQNYFKLVFRNLYQKFNYSFIHIAGLSIGIAASLLIIQHVNYEYSYDQFHQHKIQIYRVQYNSYANGEKQFSSATAYPLVGPAMKEEFPEVENYCRLFLRYGGGIMRYQDKSIQEDQVFQADPSFLEMFSYPLLKGDPATALSQPNTAVISDEAALKYFGNEDPIGKQIQFLNQEEYEITGVIQSPENSHLKFNFLLSYPTLVQQWGEQFDNSWGWYDFYTYIILNQNASPAELEKKLPDFIEKFGGQGASDRTAFVLQPLKDIHLNSNLIQEASVNGDIRTVNFLLIIAVFILAIAWINYVNLSTARGMERAKEVGIRKAIGALKGQLTRQFMFEAFLMNTLALIIALILLIIALPWLQSILGRLHFALLWSDFKVWVALILFLILGISVSGFYPALVLTNFKPISTLKGNFKNNVGSVWLRKILVVLQFSASIILIFGSIIVFRQISFMQNQDLGINIDRVLTIRGPGIVASDTIYRQSLNTFKKEVMRLAEVENFAVSTEVPGNLIYWTNGARKLQDDRESNFILYKVGIDEDYLNTYKHQILAGRGFSQEYGQEQNQVVINEMALRTFGFSQPSEALGQKIFSGGDTLSVIGVVANYNHQSLKNNYRSTAFLYVPSAQSYFNIRLNGNNLASAIEQIQQLYRSMFPQNPFNYEFADVYFNSQYASEQKFSRIFLFFTCLAIFIACLGLFGLSSFSISQRIKEIGIRKVLGASVIRIMSLISLDFIILIAVANIVGLPLAYFLMDRWLSNFAFRIGITWELFAVAAISTILIGLSTISVQTLKAAWSNPVNALRYE
ncbi:MAG: ABC transporter permease [Candidatus Cyclobacteriaceae bacterium M3_2C_046]